MNKKINIFGMAIFIMAMPIFLLANAKDTAIYYSDSKGKEVSAGISSYVAKRWKEGNLWHVMVFSYPEKALQQDGFYDDLDCKKKEGLFLHYYDNGMMKDSGLYVQDKEQGFHRGWYDTGEPDFTYHYKNGVLIDTSVSWYKTGQKSVLTVADEDGTGLQESYDDNGKIRSKGRFLKGKKDGLWVFKDHNQIISQQVVYENDSAMLVTNFDEKGVEETGIVEKGVKIVEQGATFPGGLNGWRRFLERNLQYPEAAQRSKAEGVIRVQLVVDKDGKVTNYKVLGNPNKDLAQEALRMMSISPKWIPAVQYNRKVTYRFVQTITFQLQ